MDEKTLDCLQGNKDSNRSLNTAVIQLTFRTINTDGSSYKQDVSEAEFCLPVPLQHIDTDLSLVTHVRVKNLGQEITLGWNRREVLPEDQTHSENATSKWSSLCQSIKNSSHEQYVLVVPNSLYTK